MTDKPHATVEFLFRGEVKDVFQLSESGAAHRGSNPNRLWDLEVGRPPHRRAWPEDGPSWWDELGTHWWLVNPNSSYASVRILKGGPDGKEVAPVQSEDRPGQYRFIPMEEFLRLRKAGKIGPWGVLLR